MNNDFIYKFLLFLANKSVTGNSISPEEFNMALQAANMRHFKRKIGVPEDYRPGMPIAKQGFERTQVLTDDLLPFKVHMGSPNVQAMIVDQDGYAVLPSNFFYPSALSYKYFPNNDCTGTYKTRKIDVLTDQQWDYVIGSSIRRPTLKYPAANFQAGTIRFSPTNLQRVDFVYLRYPANPVYDYYINADLDHIYLLPGTSHVLVAGEEGSMGQQPGTSVVSMSVEMEWNYSNRLDILAFILSFLGMNMREGALQQFAEMTKQSGT